ncbi:MAG: insulinase family protein [Bacteroidia bacterium]|nr:insulinase family protein [Bacteroidia bacterium]
MIKFEKFTLDNGLRVIVHTDKATPMVCMNILYDVGARDEDPNQTGFAHLFEHLMFGGSVNIPSYDTPLQRVGGENNAFTTNDITNYYLTVPSNNLETAFWLESDRMLSLAFSEKSLEVQRSVVIEEFRQRYLNQPYGDVWLLLKPLAYKVHPYRWATIGKEIGHIENAKMESVKDFFYKHYKPNNAVMVLTGDVTAEQVKPLAEKWFGPIPSGVIKKRNLPVEPKQNEQRRLTVERDVPANALYKVYHMCSRYDKEYHTVDLISDILSRGNSSRFHNELIKKQKLFSDVNAYVSGDLDKGLFVVSGRLLDGVKSDDAEKAIDNELEKIISQAVNESELVKVKNKMESSLVFAEMDIMNKAVNLAISEMMGDAELINHEVEKYNAVTPSMITEQASQLFTQQNSSVLNYLAKK